MPRFQSQIFSAGLHAALLAALLLWTTQPRRLRVAVPDRVLVLPSLRAPVMQRAGGSNQTLLPARHGLPPPQARRTFIPPVSRVEPKLPLPVTVAYESPTIIVHPDQTGDPASRWIIGALGSDGFNGIGDHGCCGGIGNQRAGAPGIDGNSGGDHKITAPQLIYKVEPEFSEAARKAKYQGVVVLAIEVDTNGRARKLRVIEPLGLGLDEKAIEAVLQWRFRPGSRDGKPVVTTATVEVSFRLM